MSTRIEDYALIGDCQTAALVAKSGSIDWLCLPRFNSPACFAALLGSEQHGCWRLWPVEEVRHVRRRYRHDTLVLETEFETESGCVRIVDFMPPRTQQPDLVRIVEGCKGKVPMQMNLRIRFDYGSIVPWVRAHPNGLRATAGPDTIHLFTEVPLHGENMHTVARFSVDAGERVPFTLLYSHTYEPTPDAPNPEQQLNQTVEWWRDWCARCTYQGEWRDDVMRSLITLKALMYEPTGGIVAAPTTSLPEYVGGRRNWDYRYCWLRDATFTLFALVTGGYLDEARRWRDWLVNAVAGTPAQVQIMYGVAGERRLTELELDWLPGYENSSPVRIGNAAAQQLQLDVYGEVMDTLHVAWRNGMQPDENAWRSPTGDVGALGDDVARARRRHLGNPRPAPAFHALKSHGVGGV